MRRAVVEVVVLGACCAAVLLTPGTRPNAVLANHANGTLASSGIGFAQVAQNGYIRVYVGQTQFAAAAQGAIDAWRARQVGVALWLAATTNPDPVQVQVEIIDGGSPSILGHTNDCSDVFPPGNVSAGYAKTEMFDDTGQRLFHDYWDPNPGHPFSQATVCLNGSQPNNQGTIAHELGHVLGLDHPAAGGLSTGFGTCPDIGYDSIMAYNNVPWTAQYPVPPTGPTWEDVNGPWVCDDRNAAGLAYIYQIPPYYGWPPDEDGDGLRRFVDNCWFVYNPNQKDTDGEILDLNPETTFYDDITNPTSMDLFGDACDADADGDGLDTAAELTSPCPSAGGPTDPLNDDSDSDRIIDGVECLLGSDPANGASVPATTPDLDHDGLADPYEALFRTNPSYPDTDGDRILDGDEVLRYRSDPSNRNTDGRTCNDGQEMASVNNDYKVNSTDLLAVAQKTSTYPASNHVRRDYDVNRNGKVNSTDLLLVATIMRIYGTGICP